MTSSTSFRLYGRPGSGSAACEAVLALAQMPYELFDLEKGADGLLPAEILALNPLRQVPVLILPDGTVMTESAAIILHLAGLAKHAGLAPTPGTAAHANYLRLMLFMAANTYMTDLRWYYPHRFSSDPSHAPAIKQKAGEDQRLNWAALEAMAANGEALLSSGLSAADIYLAVLVSWTEFDDFVQIHPKLAAIARRVAKIPAITPVWRRHQIAV
ncbi:MAG: glutathione S-transferase family protein [Rhizobiaceae bacterium]